jgi:ABC-type glycerol-3-phosphate transport system substrate-binding protein
MNTQAAQLRVPTRRSLLATLAAGTFATGLPFGQARAGALSQPTQPFALRFATNYAGVHPMAKVVRGLLGEFTRDYPTIGISVEETPGNDHQTKIKLDASSDRMPDVFNYWRLDPGFGLDQIARAGKLADLTDWTRTDPSFQGLFDDYSWRTATLDGKVYGVPAIMFYVEFLANRAVFERAGVALPTDWPSLLAAVRALKVKGELPWAISIGNDSQGGRIYNYVVNRMVGNPRALRMHSGQESIKVPEMVTAATMLRDLVVGFIPSDAISINNDAVYAKYVNSSRGALIIDGSWVTPTIRPEVLDKIEVLSFPLLPGGVQTECNVERDLTSLWYCGAKSMRDDAKRPYVQELVRRLSSRAAEKQYAEQAKQQIPALGVDVDETKYGRVAFRAQTLALSMPANKWIPSVMKPAQRSKFEPLLGEFLSGDHTPEVFVAKLAPIFGS